MNKVADKLKSRKFLLALAAIAYVVVQVLLGGVTAAEGVDTVAKLALGYLAAEGVGDAAARLRGRGRQRKS